jgi:hypothetical protein
LATGRLLRSRDRRGSTDWRSTAQTRHGALQGESSAARVATLSNARSLLAHAEQQLEKAWKQTASIGTARAYYTVRREATVLTAFSSARALNLFQADRIHDAHLLIAYVDALQAFDLFQEMVPDLRAAVESSASTTPDGADSTEINYWQAQQGRVGMLHRRVATARELFDAALAGAPKP